MTCIVNRASAGHASIHRRNDRLRRALTIHQGGVATGIAASSGSVTMHRTIAVTFAAALLLGSASTGFAQGTGGGPPSEKPPSGGPARSLADIKEETEKGYPLPAMSREREIPERAADVSGSPGKSILSPIHLSEVTGIANVKKGGRSWLRRLGILPPTSPSCRSWCGSRRLFEHFRFYPTPDISLNRTNRRNGPLGDIRYSLIRSSREPAS